MISDNFCYYQPESLAELSQAFRKTQHQKTLLYGGGTEIISMARMHSLTPEAVIDIKAIPEFQQLYLDKEYLRLGAAVTLTRIADSGLFPLLGAVVSRIADHTNQCRITLGGNIAGTIPYREAVLPLLLADAKAVVFRDGVLKKLPLRSVFHGSLRLSPGEAAVWFEVPKQALSLPWVHAKRTRGEKIDYPCVTVAALGEKGKYRFAVSGVCREPLREEKLESVFSDASLSAAERAKIIVQRLPGICHDTLAAADFRIFQTEIALEDAINRLEGKAP